MVDWTRLAPAAVATERSEQITQDGLWLLIDDVRDLGCDAIARNSSSARKLLKLGGWECVLFDHDLGTSSESGYVVLTWALENNLLPGKVQLVTDNPVGRAQMQAALEHHGYTAAPNGCHFNKYE